MQRLDEGRDGSLRLIVKVAVSFKSRPITETQVQLLNAVFAAAEKERLEPALVMAASKEGIDLRQLKETA